MKQTGESNDHREAARLCLQNAHDIAEDAQILLDAGRPARALSISIIGAEEAGKGLLHVFAALDLAPKVVAAFDKQGWHSPLSNHLFKQLAVEMIAGADAQIDDWEMAASGELPPYPPPERTARIVVGCAETLSGMFEEQKGVRAGGAWFDHIRSMLPQLKHFPAYESPDEEKMRGLYVDLGRVCGQPRDVTTSQADSACETINSTLRILAHLYKCLDDPEEWEQLRSEVGSLM